MAYFDDIDSDNEDEGIEMKTNPDEVTYPGLEVEEEEFEDEGEGLVAAVPLVQRQNRCLLKAIGIIVVVASVAGIGGMYWYHRTTVQQGNTSSAGAGEKFNTDIEQIPKHSHVIRDYSKGGSFAPPHIGADARNPNSGQGGSSGTRNHGNSPSDSQSTSHSSSHMTPGASTAAGGSHTTNPNTSHTAYSHLRRPGVGKGTSSSNAGEESTTTPPTTQRNLCDLTVHSEWLAASVKKEDGVKYEVVKRFDHDKTAFVEGLAYSDGMIWESTGINGHSSVRILDPKTMNILKEKEMESQVFGEGITYADGLLYQLTWLSHRGFIYNATTLDVVKEFKFHSTKNEGWGITWDPCRKELVMTDGSQNLHFWDRKTLTKTKVVPVTRMKGYAASQLNEIEWYRGRILANVWFEDVLLVINPETGTVEKEYDFSQLYKTEDRARHGADVFNGISISEDEDILYVTGKYWDRLFAVRLLI